MDQHSKISQYRKDIEKLTEEKIIVEKEHFQEIDLMKAQIDLLKLERDELRLNVAASDKALGKITDDLIEVKADLLIFKRESIT